jgi:SNF2 family DNA or RNA helicase
MEHSIDLTPLDTPEQKAVFRDYQKTMVKSAIRGFLNYGFHYWYSGCGTGKTLSALLLMLGMWRIADASFVLVIAVKPTMRSVWEGDINLLTQGFNVTVLDKGTTAKKLEVLQEVTDRHKVDCDTKVPADRPIEVVVVNYETARRLNIWDKPFDMVIADESHRLSSHNSKQSLVLSAECAHIPFKLDMTGTAWADHLKQVFGQFRFLVPRIYQNKNKHTGCELFGHWNDFLEDYCQYHVRDNIPIIYGYKNVDKLMETIAPHITRVRTEDVIELPPLLHVKRKFDLSPKLRKQYKEMEKEKVTTIDEDDVVAQYDMTQRHRLHQLSRGWYVSFPDNIVTRIPTKQANVALDATVGLVEELGGEPVVIFTSYIEDVDMLAEAIQKQQKQPIAFLTGGKDSHSRFTQGSANILIANLQAGSTGVRLQRAKYIIFYGLSPSTSRTNYLQAIERVHRHGTTADKVICYHMMANGTVDEDAYKLLNKKAKSEQQAEELL